MARSQESQTLNEVVAENIKRLRTSDSRRWTATELAEKLTVVLELSYTRFTVADLEGRREREIRWSEVVAMCSIFDVPLWELVLPQKGDRVMTRTLTKGDITDPRFAEIELKETVSVAMDRDGLAIRLFGLKENEIDSKLMKVKWNDRALSRSVDDLALADALLPMIRQLLRDAREESDE